MPAGEGSKYICVIDSMEIDLYNFGFSTSAGSAISSRTGPLVYYLIFGGLPCLPKHASGSPTAEVEY